MATTERFVVTGDQARIISTRFAEIQRQLFLQRDTKLDPERVIATLQNMTEGKFTPFSGCLRGRFVRTMPITIGAAPKLELIEQVKTVRTLGVYVESTMRHEAFTTLEQSELVTLIDLCPADLGFTENPTTTQLFDPKRLAEWSAANFEGYVVDLCPAEVGPHLSIQYKDQPNGEVLWIAMERIVDSGRRPFVFGVGRPHDGGRWLYAHWAGPGSQWGLDGRFVFRLRKLPLVL